MARRRSARERRARRARLTREPFARRRGRRGDRTGGRGRVLQAGILGGLIKTGIALARRRGLTPIGKRLATVIRQRASRIPGLGRLAVRTRRAREAATGLVGPSGTALATRAPSRIARVARGAGGIAAGGAAFEAGSTLFGQFRERGGFKMPKVRGTSGRRTQTIPFTPGGIVPTDSITHTWVANGVPFAQLADGRVMVRRKNGTIKTFRRPRPIVLGRNPGVRDLVRADKKIDRLLKLVKKRFPARRTAAPRHSQQHN